MKKYFFALSAALLFSGCSLFESKPAPAATQNEPIKVEMEITERRTEPAEEKTPVKSGKKEKVTQKPKAAKSAPQQERVRLPDEDKVKGGVDGELNSVEQSYLDGIRKRNKRTRDENASRVFGGWGL